MSDTSGRNVASNDDMEALPELPQVPAAGRRPRRLVLIGAEAVHQRLVLEFCLRPNRSFDVTWIAPHGQSAIPERLSEALARRISARTATRDLATLAQRAGVELIIDKVIGCEPELRALELAVHDERTYDVVSIDLEPANFGEELSRTHRTLVGVFPRATFLSRYEARLAELVQQARAARNSDALQLAVVGDDATAVELLLGLAARIQQETWQADLRLITPGPEILPGWPAGAVRAVRKLCRQRNIPIQTNSPILGCEEEGPPVLLPEAGDPIRCDLAIWSAGTSPPGLLRNYPVPRTPAGLLSVMPTLQATAGLPFFVVPPSGEIAGAEQRCYADDAQMAAVLNENLKRWARNEPLLELPPPRRRARFLTCSDGTAIVDYGGWSLRSRWAEWWRQRALKGEGGRGK